MTLKYNSKTMEWEGTTGGVDVQELFNRQPTKKVVPQKPSQDKIREEIMKNDFYAYALRLTEHITKQLNLKLGKAIFRNRATYCYNSRTKQIWFSYEHVDASVNKGFTEYPTVGHIWVNNGYKAVGRERGHWKFDTGMKAVWMIVLHEMAHAVQDSKNGIRKGSIHNNVFLQELNDLIILFPYEEVKNV